MEGMRVDLRIRDGAETFALELKYKTRNAEIRHDNETFVLQNHAAQDIGRYDFLKDVTRLETLAGRGKMHVGYAIMLTNDQRYWNKGRSGTVDEAFKLHDGREITGRLGWGAAAGDGTIKGRESPLEIQKNYLLEWRDYSAVVNPPFKYLAISVGDSSAIAAA